MLKKTTHFLLTKSIGLYINALSFVFPKKANQLAYAFFSEPRTGRLNKNELPEILKQAKKETLAFREHYFQTYLWQGNKTVILLIHGWESNASRWENLLPYLQKTGSTIIAIDAPAHGLSSGKEFNIPRYAHYIDVAVQKYKPQYLVGHSLGGKASLFYQSKYQNKEIQKMVLLGSPSDFKIIFHNYIKLLSLNTRIQQGLINHYRTHFKLKIDQFSGQFYAGNLQTKGFIAHDIDDTVVTIAEGKKIAQSWKNAHFIQTKGLGHSMHDANLYQQVVHFLFEAQ